MHPGLNCPWEAGSSRSGGTTGCEYHAASSADTPLARCRWICGGSTFQAEIHAGSGIPERATKPGNDWHSTQLHSPPAAACCRQPCCSRSGTPSHLQHPSAAQTLVLRRRPLRMRARVALAACLLAGAFATTGAQLPAAATAQQTLQGPIRCCKRPPRDIWQIQSPGLCLSCAAVLAQTPPPPPGGFQVKIESEPQALPAGFYLLQTKLPAQWLLLQNFSRSVGCHKQPWQLRPQSGAEAVPPPPHQAALHRTAARLGCSSPQPDTLWDADPCRLAFSTGCAGPDCCQGGWPVA